MRSWLLAVCLAVTPHVVSAQAHNTAAMLELRKKLLAHDWRGLELALEQRQLSSDQESRLESRYIFAFDAFVSSDSALQEHLDAWVAADPVSALPRVARGLYFVRMADAAQPQDGDEHPSRASSREVSRWLALASADAKAAIRNDPSEFMGQIVLLSIIPLETREHEARDALTAALALRPSSLHARALFVETLSPSYDVPPARMKAFADSAQRFVAINPNLRVLRGLPAYLRGNDLASRAKHDSAIVQFSKALAFGDYWKVRYERGMEYYRSDSLTKALIDLNRALAERPGHVPSLIGRALTYAHLARHQSGDEKAALMRRAEADVHCAAGLDSRDHDVRGVLNEPPSASPTPPTTVAAAPEPPASPVLDRPDDLLLLRKLLTARRFRDLDSAFAERRADATANPTHEARYVYALDVLNTDDPALRAPLDDWVARDTTRSMALSARAAYFVARGWHARGTETIDKVSEAQRDEMHGWLVLAAKDASRAARIDTSDIAPHVSMMTAAMLTGSDDFERRLLVDAVKRQPASVLIRARYMYSLRPAWGGTIAGLERFAELQQTKAHLNPRMSMLLGLADLERGDDLADDDQYQAAVVAYTKAIARGGHWSFYYRRGLAYRNLEEPEKMMADLERAVIERPASATALAWLAVAGVELADEREGVVADSLVRRARRDFQLAEAFDANDSDVKWVRESFPALTDAPPKPHAKRR